MHDSLNIVDQVMNLALEDRFEIFLHFTTGHLNINSQGEGFALFEIGDVRTD